MSPRPPSESDALRRADAAERTVQVLKKKVYDLYNGDSSSLLHRQLEKARRREENNRAKRDLIELRAKELKRYSEVLELEVARRTASIKTILDNVTFGFLIVERDLIVQPECTKSCYALFDSDRVEGEHLGKLLGLSDRGCLGFTLGIDQVFEDVLPSDVSLAQIQRKFVVGGTRTLQAEGSALRGNAGEVIGILFTVSDITALESVMAENNNNRTLVSILKQKDSFRSFLMDSKLQLETATRAIGQGNQATARHAIHTLKGNSASFGLDTLVDIIHQVEEAVAFTSAHVDQIASSLSQFVRTNERVLELDFDQVGDASFEVSREQMTDLRDLIGSLNADSATALRRWTAHVLRKPAWHALGPVDDFAQKLAERLGRSLKFELFGGDVVVDVETVRPVFQVITHLIRNAIDHGMEGPMERRDKAPVGSVRLELIDRPDAYVLRCSDDGRGIDTGELSKRAVAMGLRTKAMIDAMTEDAKCDLVFVDGLSSAPVITSISGRGVGMSAVKAAVDRVGGSIQIESKRGLGTTFTITIPKPDDVTIVASETVRTSEAVA